MGWGTGFKADVYLNKSIFRHVTEVEDAIKDLDIEINKAREQLFILIGGGPNMADLENKEDKVYFLHTSGTDLLEIITSCTKDKVLFTLYLDYLNDNNITHIKQQE